MALSRFNESILVDYYQQYNCLGQKKDLYLPADTNWARKRFVRRGQGKCEAHRDDTWLESVSTSYAQTHTTLNTLNQSTPRALRGSLVSTALPFGSTEKSLPSIHFYLPPFTTVLGRSVVGVKAGYVLDKSPVYHTNTNNHPRLHLQAI